MDLWTPVQSALRRGIIARGACSAEARVGENRVHFYDLPGHGEGPPLVLVHGLGSSGTSFSRVMFPLRSRFRRILVPDLPGNGFSALPASGPLRILEQLDVLEGFLQQTLDGVPCFMVGNSLGGAMALALALRSPQRLKALGLIAPAGAKVQRERMESLVRSLEVNDTRSARAVTRRLFHRAPLSALLFSPLMKQVYGSATVKSILGEVHEVELFSPEALASLQVPTLLLWGASEKLLPYESVDYFRAHLPALARVEIVEGFGHIPQLERPAEVVSRFLHFADDQKL